MSAQRDTRECESEIILSNRPARVHAQQQRQQTDQLDIQLIQRERARRHTKSSVFVRGTTRSALKPASDVRVSAQTRPGAVSLTALFTRRCAVAALVRDAFKMKEANWSSSWWWGWLNASLGARCAVRNAQQLMIKCLGRGPGWLVLTTRARGIHWSSQRANERLRCLEPCLLRDSHLPTLESRDENSARSKTMMSGSAPSSRKRVTNAALAVVYPRRVIYPRRGRLLAEHFVASCTTGSLVKLLPVLARWPACTSASCRRLEGMRLRAEVESNDTCRCFPLRDATSACAMEARRASERPPPAT